MLTAEHKRKPEPGTIAYNLARAHRVLEMLRGDEEVTDANVLNILLLATAMEIRDNRPMVADVDITDEELCEFLLVSAIGIVGVNE